MNEQKKVRLSTFILVIIITILLVGLATTVVWMSINQKEINQVKEEAMKNEAILQQQIDLAKEQSQQEGTNQLGTGQGNTITNEVAVTPILDEPQNSNESTTQTSVELNNRIHSIKLQYSYSESTMDGTTKTYKQNIIAYIDGRKIEEIKQIEAQDCDPKNFVIPEIKTIKGEDGKDYMLFKVSEKTSQSLTTDTYYVIDENGYNIGNVVYSNSSKVILKNDNVALQMISINENSIQIVKVNGISGADIHKYTVGNGAVNDNIIKTYSAADIIIQ